MADEQSKKPLAAVIEEDRKARVASAIEEVNAVLAKHNCRLDATFILKENLVEPRITIISK